MTSRSRCAAITVLAASLVRATASVAAPGSASEELAQAEQAFEGVDFEGAYEHATHALETGGATREETARLEVLVGRTAAALANDDVAKRAFVAALAIDPTLKLEQSLSPKLRAPYLEALGYWGSFSERLGLDAKVTADHQRISVRLIDPAHLVSKIAVHLRVVGTGRDESLAADAKGSVSLALSAEARGHGFDYYVQALDEHRNVVAELGSDADPREERVHAGPIVASLDGAGARSGVGRSYVWPIALAVAGFGAVGVGVAFHLQRESAAREWNGPGCERPGASRIEQCGDVDSRLRLDESVAIGAYVAGGALLTGSVVALFVGRKVGEPGPEPARAGFRGCTVAGSSLWCSARF
jgi:hypothetical protein